MKPASRYHPLLVALHWLLAALILAALAVGFFGLAAMPNADPQKIAGLPEIVFAESGAPLPMSFAVYPIFLAHFWLAALLVRPPCRGRAVSPARPHGRPAGADELRTSGALNAIWRARLHSPAPVPAIAPSRISQKVPVAVSSRARRGQGSPW
jgi:hypothetical protein